MTEKDICRSCLTKKDKDSTNPLQKITETVEHMYEKLFGALITDYQKLPKFMCQKCIQSLHDSFIFHFMVLSSAKQYKVLEAIPKIEEEDSQKEELILKEIDCGDYQHDESLDENLLKRYKRRSRTKMVKSEVELQDLEIQKFFDMSCNICLCLRFPTFRQFSAHMKESHGTKVPYILCCKKKLFKRSELLDHLNYHQHPEKYQCPLCKHQCYDIYQLKKHSNKCEGPDRPEEFKCEICSLSFSSINTLSSHRNAHLSREEKDLKRIHACDRCSARFTSIYRLNRHYKERHEGISSFLCHGCAKSFYSKSDFLVHWKSIHAATSKVKCPDCGSLLKHERALRRHLRNMHQSKGPWICKECGKETPTIEALRSHERYSHSEASKLHECNICDKKFKKQVTLREHLTTHFDDTKKLPCESCDKSFNSSANLIKHRKKMHFE